MSFAGINYMAVLMAGVAGFLFGGLWYGLTAKPWMAAVGKTEADLKGPDGRSPVLLYVFTFLCQLLMAWVLAGVIGHLGKGQVTLRNGIVSGLFIWAGFVITTMAVAHAFQGQKRTLTLIDGGHWLGVLLLQGAIIGWMGVR